MDVKANAILYTRSHSLNYLVEVLQNSKRLYCYGPYKQDSTSTKKRLVLGQDQYTECGTNKTSKTIGQGVAELYNYIHTERTYVLIYLYTKHTNILTY